MSEWKASTSTAGAAASAGERSIVGEFVEALRSAVVTVLDEQKLRAAERVATVGRALHRGGEALDPAETPILSGWVRRGADQVDGLAAELRMREWGELASDMSDFARRRPGLFIGGAVALGFIAGRLLAPPPRPAGEPAAPVATPSPVPAPVTPPSAAAMPSVERVPLGKAPDAP